ncbi:GNAT family N-acetyltransferase [Gordonia sputi]
MSIGSIRISAEKSSPGLRAIDDLFSTLIPDATASATSPMYRNDPDTVVLKAVNGEGDLVGALTAHSDRPDLAQIPPQVRVRLGSPSSGAVRIITQMAVRPEVQRQGVGSQLLAAAEADFSASGANLSLLFVDDRSEAGSASFYLSQNYVRGAEHTEARGTAPTWLPETAGLYRVVSVARSGWFFYKEISVPGAFSP